jgi:hypothetical protein
VIQTKAPEGTEPASPTTSWVMEWLDKLIPTGVTLVVVTLALIAIR